MAAKWPSNRRVLKPQETNKEISQKIALCPQPQFNPRPGGGLSHLRHGGGGKMTTPPNSKTKRDRKARKKRSIALNEYNRKYFSHFFAKVNIDVIRGHQRSILAECQIFFRKCAIISEPIISSRPQEDVLIALLILFR